MTQAQALDILKSGANVFLTGEPGSGKTHTINEYVRYLRSHKIEPAITASTGIAATHIGGMTIHSWSGIGIKNALSKRDLRDIVSSKYIVDRIKDTHILIIDEISMLSATTLTMVDMVCQAVKNKKEPFGGMQIVLVGDFFQLPPVVRREEGHSGQTTFLDDEKNIFAYSSPAWTQASLSICYLSEQHRQDDSIFFSLLSAIRKNNFGDDHLQHLEERRVKKGLASDNVTKLFSHNMDVDRVNDAMLQKLAGETHSFVMGAKGNKNLLAIMKKGCLSPETLCLKKDAVVMFTKNNPREGFVNGTLGTVISFDGGNGHPVVKAHGGRKIVVESMDWTVEENGEIRARITQIPLRLAWAITVHKSQGMSLDAAVMDLSNVFEFGQGYVALSRVRRFSGLHLLGWNQRAFQVHPDVLAQDDLFREASLDAEKEFWSIDVAKLKKIHESFITRCGGEITPLAKGDHSSPKSKRKKVNTYQETLTLWLEGKNITEIAVVRSLHERTIFSHIEHLVDHGHILLADIFARLVTDSLAQDMSRIHAMFKKAESMLLSPVFEKFEGKYSYEELRIARMLMGEQGKNAKDKIGFDELKEKHPHAYSPWSKEQDGELVELFLSGESTTNLAKIFSRTKGAIRSRLIKLGLVDKMR